MAGTSDYDRLLAHGYPYYLFLKSQKEKNALEENFWASWCSPCRYEMKNGSPGLHKQFEGNKDVVFLYISIDDSTDKWKKAIDEYKIDGGTSFVHRWNTK